MAYRVRDGWRRGVKTGVVAALLTFAIAPASAAELGALKAEVEALYSASAPAGLREVEQSRALKDLFAKEAARAEKEGIGNLDFDPVVNGQDAEIGGVTVSDSVVFEDRAVVVARFRNFETVNVLVYSFVEEDGTWRLDDIASLAGESRWVLSSLLTAE